MLKLPSKRIIDVVHVGTTTILEYEIYEDGTSSKPRVVKSYNFVPEARRLPKRKKEKKKIEIVEEEVGTL